MGLGETQVFQDEKSRLANTTVARIVAAKGSLNDPETKKECCRKLQKLNATLKDRVAAVDAAMARDAMKGGVTGLGCSDGSHPRGTPGVTRVPPGVWSTPGVPQGFLRSAGRAARAPGGALCWRAAPCFRSRGRPQTRGRPMGQPHGGCAAFFGAARCAQRRKTANAHFEPLAVEFPRSFLARGGSTRYGREYAPPMNICWAVVVVNQPRTGGRRFPPTTVDNKVRS